MWPVPALPRSYVILRCGGGLASVHRGFERPVCSSVRPPLLLPRLCVINLFILPHTDPTGFGGKEIRVPYCNRYSGLGQEEDICKTHRCAEQLSRPMRVAYSWINIIDTTHAPDWMTAAGYTKFSKKET